jgi:GT2 family glycosyltransferase
MLLRIVQRIVRVSPRAIAVAWGLLPNAVRRRARRYVYPIAVGRRGGGLVIGVPADEGGVGSGPPARSGSPSVSIVIVTYENPALLADCLRAVRRGTPWEPLEVVVVDNGASSAPSPGVRGLATRWIESGRNLGFSRGANRGIAASTGEVVVLLNDDVVVTPGWLAGLVAHLEDNPRLGIVCPVTNEIGSDARVEATYRSYDELCTFAEERAERYGGRSRTTEVVPLFCAAVRRATLERVGGLDERYEVGMFEDDDLSLALRHAGYDLAVAEDVFVHHVGQASFSRLSDAGYLKIWQTNRRRFERKWGRPWLPPEGG